MCQNIRSKRYFIPVLYSIMIVLGIITGYFDIPILKPLGLIVSQIFIKIFKCISLPIIFLSIIVTLAQTPKQGKMISVWRRAMTYTFATTFIAALVSFILYVVIKPIIITHSPLVASTIQNSNSYLDYLKRLIPENLLAPFLEQQVLSVLIIGIVIGCAIRYIKEEKIHQTAVNFFRALHSVFMIITQWIIIIIPLGLFGFITTTVAQIHNNQAIKGLSEYLAVIILANLIQGFIVLPAWLKFQNIKPFWAMKAMSPALMVAFFSKSSVGTLPVTIKTAENNLNVSPEISRFVLPLCTSLNMNGCAAFIFVTVTYLMQNNGIQLSLASMAVWIIISTIAAIGNAGVPMGCFFLSASLLSSMNVPITLMGLILPFYSIIDMLETALNVWSDASVAKVVDAQLHQDTAVI